MRRLRKVSNQGLSAIALVLVGPLLFGSALAADCSVTSVGFTPVNDLGTGTYLGFEGGLYPGGSNVRPLGHENDGVSIAQSIVARDSAGNPDAGGKYVLLSIGMSNTSREFTALIDRTAIDPDIDPNLVVVNGAQGGATASDWAELSNGVWPGAEQRLAQQSVTANQVAVVWLKLAESAGGDTPAAHRVQLQQDIEATIRNLKVQFPNIELVYLSSRIYAGYASISLNPEPFAYETGFVVKWIIEKQLGGDATLNFDPDAGPVNAPWLSWGPYLWADGEIPRSDGLTWRCEDLDDDGTHPSDTGRQKVADRLLEFFKSDLTAREWYSAGDVPVDETPPAAPTDLVVEP